MGWISVLVVVASLLTAAICLVRLGAVRWWDYLFVVVLTGLLWRPLLFTVTGDLSAWLPGGIWSDGSDGKDQIIIASVAATVLLPLVCAAAALCAAKRLIALFRP